MTRAGTAHLGTFDAEEHWRPAGLARLPAVPDPRGPERVAAMDELLAGFCAPGDLLVTRRPVPAALREVLASARVSPRYRTVAGDPDPGVPVERAALDDPGTVAALAGCRALAPFAVLPDTAALAGRTGHADRLPDAAAVARVNSKTFSDEVVHQLGLPGGGRVVRSVAALRSAVAETGGAAMVKDPYGVGGRGIVEVASPGVLDAVARTLQRQADRGMRVELVVQPKWPKRRDVSGYLEIHPGGRVDLVGMQVLEHPGLSHVAVGPMPAGLREALAVRGYTDALLRAGAAVAEAGYHGPVGVDSLLLDDGRLVPVLEINARRTVGMLNLALDRRARRHGLRSHLWRTTVDVPGGDGVGALIGALHAAGALHGETSPGGVLPLGGGALRPPRDRLECALICAPEDVRRWRHRLRQIAQRTGTAGRAPA